MTCPLRSWLLAVVVVASFNAGSAHAQVATPLAGYAAVTDGDTIRIGRARIRLFGINAPEIDTAEGQAARRQLVALIGRSEVRCDDTGQRSYDRIVARCFVGQVDLARQMVAQGWAYDWPRFSHGRYAAEQRRAQREGRGLHAD